MSHNTEYKIVEEIAEIKPRDKRKLYRSRKFFLLIHGGCIFLLYAYFSYFNATISTLEKRFHIPSRISGLIVGGFDAASIFAPFLGYFIAKRHRPKWLSLIVFLQGICALQNGALHLYYGPGEDALKLTKEYGDTAVMNSSYGDLHENGLCRNNSFNGAAEGDNDSNEMFPQIYLYVNQIFGGIFGAGYDSLGISYLDDNVPKSKMPLFLSVIQMLRVMAPLLGFNLATVTLNQYISPYLTPIIDQNDTRWLGAWWMGWIVLGSAMIILSCILSQFPKILKKQNEKLAHYILSDKRPSILKTFSRIFTNKIYILNIISTTLNFMGILPYWIYTAKYIEVQYKISASESSFIFGTIVQSASASGTLLMGYVVYKIKPSARRLVLFNILIVMISSVLLYGYTFFGCTDNQSATVACIPDCDCVGVKYNPICGDDGNTYVSPCHAGCLDITANISTVSYTNCTCIAGSGGAYSGSCATDCTQILYKFLFLMSITGFIMSCTKSNMFLFAMRAVEPADKTVALATMTTIISYFAFIPSPIIYGWIIDRTCVFWDNSSTDTGNCWRYDEDQFRFNFNVTAIFFLILGALFGDSGLWFYVKDLKLFDDDKEDFGDDRSLEDIIL